MLQHIIIIRKCNPDPFAICRYVRRRDRWTIWMGGAGRSGDGLRMVSRVSVGGAGRSVRMVSRVSVGGLGAGLCRVCL